MLFRNEEYPSLAATGDVRMTHCRWFILSLALSVAKCAVRIVCVPAVGHIGDARFYLATKSKIEIIRRGRFYGPFLFLMSYAYLFPGQGSQEVGMGHDAYLRSPAARALFDEADALFGFPFSDLIFSGPEEKLTDTENQQPALFITSLAYWQVALEQKWPKAQYLAGHSLGEISALAASGALSFADGLALVRERGRLMKTADEKAPGGMAAVLALDVDLVGELCAAASQDTGQVVQIANDNCPGQTVISGHEQALLRAMELAQEAGARKIVRLPITIAAHSELMSPVALQFAQAVDAIPLREPETPVIGNVSARPLSSIADIQLELKRQLTSPVAWTESMQALLAQDVDTFIEIGPGTVLLGLMKRIDRKSKRIEFSLDRQPPDL